MTEWIKITTWWLESKAERRWGWRRGGRGGGDGVGCSVKILRGRCLSEEGGPEGVEVIGCSYRFPVKRFVL